MKEDAAAKELENLLRDALDNPQSSRQPGGQLKTVPLAFQPAAAAPVSSVGRIDLELGRAEDPDDVPRLAVDAFATTPPPPAKSRAGLFAALGVAVIALAAGGAAWKMKHAQAAAAPVVAQAAPVAAPTEGAVGFAVAARPADAPAPAPVEPKPEEAVGAATIAKADVAKPEIKAAPPVDPKPVVAPVAPAPKPVVAVAPPPPAPKPVVAAAPPPPAPAPKPAAAPAPASVDAILQQQLKGAIP